MRRFPLRTLLLMVIALLAFLRLYYVTHTSKAPGAPPALPAEGPSPACRTLERALEAAIRAPEDEKALAEARKQLEGCPLASTRACELGPAMDARTPVSAGDTPLRGLLAGLCQQCTPATNPCVQAVSRTLLTLTGGRPPELAELRWNLEHAGPGLPQACGMLTRATLVPAALATQALSPAQRSVLGAAAPLCPGGALPAPLVNAAAVQQGDTAPELAKLAANPASTDSPLKPDEVLGAEAGRNAFDANAKTGVDLGNASTGKRWEADGALRAQFNPPVKVLASLRVRASGPGTLRAIVRAPQGMGLQDPERKVDFVHPTACRFKGTGQWEACALKVPLLDVDALSVFPEQPRISLHEVEALGTR